MLRLYIEKSLINIGIRKTFHTYNFIVRKLIHHDIGIFMNFVVFIKLVLGWEGDSTNLTSVHKTGGKMNIFNMADHVMLHITFLESIIQSFQSEN